MARPVPCGWRILIKIREVENKTAGGILLPDKTQDEMRLVMNVGEVLDVGPLAYRDADKFDGAAWCKPGDFVLVGKYAGLKIKCKGPDGKLEDLRILNDDEVIAVIDDPASISM